MSRWRVWNDDDEWIVISPEYEERWFPTWREALDYADRLARTREVVLPRFTALPTSRHIVHKSGLIIERENNEDFPNLPPKYLTVRPDELRPLAGVLLALAEQEEA